MKLNRKAVDLAQARACLSRKELCEKAGVSTATLAHLKAGRREPSPKTIGRLARALECDVTELLEDPIEQRA